MEELEPFVLDGEAELVPLEVGTAVFEEEEEKHEVLLASGAELLAHTAAANRCTSTVPSEVGLR